MLLPDSSGVCIPSFRAVAPRDCFIKVQFWLLFVGMTRMQEGYGLIDILEMLP